MSATAAVTGEAPERDLDATAADAATSVSGSSGSKGIGAWLVQVAGWLVILAVVAISLVMLVLPRAAGAEPYTILTGSMRTIYPPGTLVVTKPIDPDQVKIGDVITFQLDSGKSAVVTHRVIGVRTGTDGEPEFITKGDANPSPDTEAVRSVQLRGKLWYAVPYLGRVNTLLSGHQRQLAVYGVAGGLAIYAGGMFLSALGERRRRTTTTSPN